MKKPLPLLVLLFLGSSIFLGNVKGAAAQDDPPTRVARLNYTQGSVSFSPRANRTGSWPIPTVR